MLTETTARPHARRIRHLRRKRKSRTLSTEELGQDAEHGRTRSVHAGVHAGLPRAADTVNTLVSSPPPSCARRGGDAREPGSDTPGVPVQPQGHRQPVYPLNPGQAPPPRRGNMGFLHQLHLLLWKNISLKKRGPWVLAFEIFIPLVLFFILLGLRQKKPAIPVKEAFYSAAPLTSAGIIPIMQSLCPDGQRDEFGFLQYKNSTVTQLLERLSEVVEQNRYFMSDRPGLGRELETLQQHLDSISSTPLPPDQSFNKSQGFTLASVLKNQSVFQQFLVSNLSLSNSTASMLLTAPVSLSKVYNLIIGTSLRDNPQAQNIVRGVKETKPESGDEVLQVKGLLLTGSMLELLTCGESGGGELGKILLVSEKQRPALQAYNRAVCGGEGGQRSERFRQLSEELREQINTHSVSEKLHLEQPNWLAPLSLPHLRGLLKDLGDVERLLKEVDLLSSLARLLPKGACSGKKAAPPTNATWSFNATSWGLNTTDIPGEEGDGGGEKSKKGKEEAENPHSQFSAFVQLWAGLQPILCGNNRIIEPEALKQGNMSSLGFTSKEQRNLGLLVHLMTTNPKILYSPIGSQVDKVIQKARCSTVHVFQTQSNKANETFAFVGNVTHYTRVWLNISAQLRTFLEEGRLQSHLMWLQQLSLELQQHPGLWNSSDSELMQCLMEGNYTLPNTSTLLEQLDTIDNAACGWSRFMSKVSVDVFKGFPDEDSIVNYTLNQAYHDNVSVFASVIFQTNKDGSLPPHVLYKIRQNSSFTEKTNEIRRAYWRPGPNSGGKFYFLYGFVWIQDMIERAIINSFVGHDVVEPGNYVQMFPYPCYTRDDFLFVIEHMMPLCMVISWVYSVAMMIQHIVAEKEHRLKEVMKMMGLNNAVHWVAWFITGFVQLSISVTALTAILKYGRVLLHSDPLIIWLFLTIYAVATIMFCFLVSVIYSKAKLASACGGIIYFLSYVPYMYVAIREEVAHDKITAFEKCIASLMSTTAFGLGSKYFALYEVAGVGIQWRTISQSPVEGDDFNLGLSMMMLIIDAAVYGVLTWYIEAVHPGMYGLPRPWYFPLQRSYWSGSGRVETWDWPWWGGRAARLSVMEEDQACAMDMRRSEEMRGIEEDPSHLPLVVCIDKLTKVYKNGSKLALNKLSLNLHENQVVSFLGHNGAGKTTTMSILTGLFPPTSGSATIYGHDIRTEMERIRQNLGMCPQHNVLFDKLSVEEHLWFYSRLKGMAEEDIRKEMEKSVLVRMIVDLELSHKRHSLVQTLSGGMKRKLSVAIAFVGGSRAVILDEPTAGVDPYARRAIWDLILKYKRGQRNAGFICVSICSVFTVGRTILLSTHHMDEADLLGDRIAIISHGKLKCCGSPLFLKSTYGDGYKLTLVKKQAEGRGQGSQQQPASSLSPSAAALPCSEARVTQFICQFVASCLLVSDSNTELSYILPSEAVKKGCFERLFQALEQNLTSLALTSFGVMDTTLEEVFLKVSEEDHSIENSDADGKGSPGGSSVGKSSVGSETQAEPLAEGDANEENENPEVESSSLLSSSKLSQSQSSLKSSSSVGSVRGDEGGLYSDFYGDYCPLFDNYEEPDSATARGDEESSSSPPLPALDEQGSLRLEGWWLKLSQFHGLIIKRFHCAKRNTKGLFSQILLPAFFVCVAMTVALSVPAIGDLPPLILSPSQYHNYTQPRGNFIPYANEDRTPYRIMLSPDASPQKIVNTLRLPSGVGATCVLKTPFNSTLDQLAQTLNPNANNSKTLAAQYFDSMCLDSFTQGVPLSNFVPPPPSPAPSDYPEAHFEDELWNFTVAPPATVPEPVTSPPSLPLSIREPVRCTCSMQGTGFSCPSGVGGRPPVMKVVTGDILVDITGRNVSEYLLFTSDRLRLHRYGCLTVGNIQKSVPASFGIKIPPMVRKIAVRRSAQVREAPRPKPTAAVQHVSDRATSCIQVLLQGTDVVIAIFIIVAMSFVPASFVVFLVAEKSTKAKHLQFVSGCDPVIYWLANYIWDMLNYLVPATCCVIILFVFDLPAYTSRTNFPAVLSLFLLYGWSITPIMYPASFWFEVPSTAYVFLIVINLFIGITATVATFLLQLFEHDKDLKNVNSYLKTCFLIFPNYNLGHGLMEMAYNEYLNEYYAKIGQFDKIKSPFEWDIVTQGLVAMAIEGFIGFLITILCQYNFLRKPPMEQVVEVLGIEDYSVSQTTLDNMRLITCFFLVFSTQVFVNFAKKQSDNLDTQVLLPAGGEQSPFSCILNLLKPRPPVTELNSLISEASEELETDDDEGLISFEEERVSGPFPLRLEEL
ncbi:unnamed protein product [Menidia menidia]|uniref:(Atlantic silverside) hypothetical protein n=1 Tax=Menidia menidia TaxID=238744 RepID=A0A8S4AV70_9TELE|nr:unnamed protein product [Menidia menidia]